MCHWIRPLVTLSVLSTCAAGAVVTARSHGDPGKTCNLKNLNLNLYLFTMVRTDDDMLMRYFLEHYVKLGVNMQKAQILLHKIDDASDQKMRSLLGQFGVGTIDTKNDYASVIKQFEVNKWLRMLPLDAWVIYPDSDEFFEFPCNIRERIANGENVFWGKMLDRFGPGYSFPELQPSTPLAEQYPVSCNGLRKSIGADDFKHMLFKAQVGMKPRQMSGSHDLKKNKVFQLAEVGARDEDASVDFLELSKNPPNEQEIPGFPHYDNIGKEFTRKLVNKMHMYQGKRPGLVSRLEVYQQYLWIFNWDGGDPDVQVTPTVTEKGRTLLDEICIVA